MPATDRQFSFGNLVVDLSRACLLRDGRPVGLRPKAFDALVYLVRNPGRLITKQELLEQLWPETFVTEDSLFKCIREVRDAVGDDGHRLIRTVPRRGYIFEGRVSAGVRRRDPRVVQRPGPAALGALLVATAIGSVYWATQVPAPEPKSVAVLPFENLSSEPDTAVLTAGIHESILTQLSKIGGMRTIAGTTMRSYGNTAKPVSQIAEELNVAAVLEGSVQYAGERLRIAVQLIEPESDLHLWSEEYDGRRDDILPFQRDIARQIAAALDARLSDADAERLAAATDVPAEAYELYLRGRYHWDKTEARELEKGIDYFRQAIRLDPGFALAYAGLADSYTILGALSAVPPRTVIPQAREAAETALALDPDLAEGYVARGTFVYFYDWDFPAGRADLERAIELNPNLAIAHHLLGKNVVVEKRFDESLAALDRALTLDPFSERIHLDVGQTLYFSRRFDEAVAAFERSGELDPGSLTVRYWLMRSAEMLGDPDATIHHHLARQRAGRYASNDLPAPHRVDADRLEKAYRDGGWNGYWRLWTEMLTAVAAHRYVEPYRFVEAHARLEQRDAVLAALEAALADRSAWLPIAYIDPLLEPLYDDPAFLDLLSRAGLARYHAPPDRADSG